MDPNVVSHSISWIVHLEERAHGAERRVTRTKDPWQAFAISSNHFSPSGLSPFPVLSPL